MPASFDLTLLFDNDFADLFEVRGERRPRRGVGSEQAARPDRRRAGIWRARRASHGSPRCISIRGRRGCRRQRRDPIISSSSRRPVTSLFVTVSCNKPIMQKPVPFFRGLLAHRREMRTARPGAATIETSNNIFNEVLCQAMADLNMLMTETPQGRYPYAGIPWYSTTFGRDGLITALQMLWVDPRIAKGVLKRLAAVPGQDGRSIGRRRAGQDPARDARRRDGGAARGAVRALLRQRRSRRRCSCCWPGSICERTGDDRDACASCGRRSRRRLQWIDGPGDPDGDGFIEYQRATEQGLRNQGWKDSFDAIFHADGALAEGNIALCGGAGLCVRRPSGLPRARRAGSALRTGRLSSMTEAEAAAPSGSRTRSGARTSAPMRWRSTAPSSRAGCARPMPASCCSAASSPRPRTTVAADLMSQCFFSGWGIRTVARGRAPLQSDVLSRRLDLAARQCADRARFFALRPRSARWRICSRVCSMPRATWSCGGCRSCSAASSASAGADRCSIRWPARRRRGPARRRSRCWRPRSGSNSTPRAARSGCAIRACRNSSTRWCCATSQLGASSVDLRLRRHGERGVARSVAHTRPNPGVDRADALKRRLHEAERG